MNIKQWVKERNDVFTDFVMNDNIERFYEYCKKYNLDIPNLFGELFADALYFSNDVRKRLDTFQESDIKAKHGFYMYDSEWGNIPISNVVLWAEIPDYEGV